MRIATPPIPSSARPMPLAPLPRVRSARPAPSPLTSPRHGRVTAGRVTTGRRAPGVTTSAIRRPSAAVPTVHGPSTNRSSFYEQRCKRRPKRPPLFMRSAGSSAEATLVVAERDTSLRDFSLRRLQAGRVGPIVETQRSFGLTRFFEHGVFLGARRQKRSLLACVLRKRGEAIL